MDAETGIKKAIEAIWMNHNRKFRGSQSYKPIKSTEADSQSNEVATAKSTTQNAQHTKEELTAFLFTAANEGNVKKVKSLIKQGVDVNAMDMFGTTVIMVAAKEGHLATVRALLDNNAHIEDGQYNSALIWAAWSGHLHMVELLLQRGANIRAVDESGNTALLDAARMGHLKVVNFLLAHGSSLNDSHNPVGDALHWARYKGHTEVVESLLAHKQAAISAASKQVAVPKYWAEEDIELYNAAISKDLSQTKYLLVPHTAYYLFKLHFNKYSFGTQFYTPRFLSMLPPKDRVVILEIALLDDKKNYELHNRLAMAYYKVGQKRQAHKFLNDAKSEGNIPVSLYNVMTEKLRQLHILWAGEHGTVTEYGSSTSYSEALRNLAKDVDAQDEVDYKEFLAIFHVFCALSDVADEQKEQNTQC